MTEVFIDFETFSEVPLKDCGAWRYAQDPSTEVLCCAYSIDRGPIKLWTLNDDDPEDLLDAVESGATVWAHNASFEYVIWNYTQTHWPKLKIDQIRCSMALVAYHSFPQSLDKAGEAVGANTQKDKEGARLIRKFCTPRKPSKNNPNTRIYPHDDAKDFKALCDYCVTDVATEMAIHDKLPLSKLPEKEQEIFEVNLRLNDRGIRVDVETVKHIINLASQYGEVLEAKADKIMGGRGLRTSQRSEVMQWAASQGFELENYQAPYIRELLKRNDLPENVYQVLEIREALAKTSVTKYNKMIVSAGLDGKVRGTTAYYGAARTGRFAGRLLQVQNLPRGTIKGAEAVAEYMRFLELEDVETILEKPMEAFSSLIRSMLLADEGYTLYVTDFSNIEGRVLAWMAGQDDVVRQFASGDDLYIHMAATIFAMKYEQVSKDGIERFVGKQAVLGCGYGMGAAKFEATCEGYGQNIGADLAKKAVKAYRKKNYKIVRGWYAVEEAAREAIESPGLTTKAMKCKFTLWKGFLWIQLPGERSLAYNKPLILDGRITYMGVDQFSGKWVRQETYGGKLVENIVQAVARDIMAEAMVRVDNAGFDLLATIHDELVSQAPIGFSTIEEYNRIVSVVPEWAKGCPIDVDGWVGPRYRK